jgi:hypothetical protein
MVFTFDSSIHTMPGGMWCPTHCTMLMKITATLLTSWSHTMSSEMSCLAQVLKHQHNTIPSTVPITATPIINSVTPCRTLHLSQTDNKSPIPQSCTRHPLQFQKPWVFVSSTYQKCSQYRTSPTYEHLQLQTQSHIKHTNLQSNMVVTYDALTCYKEIYKYWKQLMFGLTLRNLISSKCLCQPLTRVVT